MYRKLFWVIPQLDLAHYVWGEFAKAQSQPMVRPVSNPSGINEAPTWRDIRGLVRSPCLTTVFANNSCVSAHTIIRTKARTPTHGGQESRPFVLRLHGPDMLSKRGPQTPIYIEEESPASSMCLLSSYTFALMEAPLTWELEYNLQETPQHTTCLGSCIHLIWKIFQMTVWILVLVCCESIIHSCFIVYYYSESVV